DRPDARLVGAVGELDVAGVDVAPAYLLDQGVDRSAYRLGRRQRSRRDTDETKTLLGCQVERQLLGSVHHRDGRLRQSTCDVSVGRPVPGLELREVVTKLRPETLDPPPGVGERRSGQRCDD